MHVSENNYLLQYFISIWPWKPYYMLCLSLFYYWIVLLLFRDQSVQCILLIHLCTQHVYCLVNVGNCTSTQHWSKLRHGDRTQEYDLIYLLLTFDLLKHFALSQVEGHVNKRYLGMIFSVMTRFSSTSEKIKTNMAAHELLSRLLGFFVHHFLIHWLYLAEIHWEYIQMYLGAQIF